MSLHITVKIGDETIGLATVSNLSNLADYSTYSYVVKEMGKGPARSKRRRRSPVSGVVMDFPRLKGGPWDLLRAVLNDMAQRELLKDWKL